MRRRDILKAAPVAAIGAITPSVASEPGDRELFALLDEWRAQYDACNNSGVMYDNPDDDVEWSGLLAIEERIAEICPKTVEGFAAKLLALTTFGDFGCLEGTAASILDDAEAFGALLPPSTFHPTV